MENEKKAEKLKSIRHIVVVYLTIAVATLIGIILLYTQVLVNAYIPSESMENTLMTGDRIIGNRLAYKNDKPKRFDVVIFYAPDFENVPYIKRVIGLPGEKVRIKNGLVYINDSKKPLDDSFVKETVDIEDPVEFMVP